MDKVRNLLSAIEYLLFIHECNMKALHFKHIPQEYFTNKRQFVPSQANAMSVFTCRKGSNMRM